MTEFKVEPCWQDDADAHRYRQRLKAIKNQTAHCPCDICVGWNMCKQTGHECAGYLRWVATGSTKEETK